MSQGIRVQAWARTDVGKVRSENQDSYLLDRRLGLFVVADGMGGGPRGDIASALTCNVVQEYISDGEAVLSQYRHNPSAENLNKVGQLLTEAVRSASDEVFEASSSLAGQSGRMGSTLEAILIVGNHAICAHVGDSRIWLVRSGEATQLTKDHTLAQERADLGIPPEQTPKRAHHLVTRAIGVVRHVQPDLHCHDLRVGDSLLLASDGLYRYVQPPEIVAWLKAASGPAVVDSLVSLANSRGGRDNITVMLLSVQSDGDITAPLSDTKHLAALRRCELFATCTTRELQKVAFACRMREFPAGATIFKEGDSGWECFILQEGTVEIHKGSRRLAILEIGDHFGAMSLIETPARSASARAISATKVLVLSQREFSELLRRDAVLATRVMLRLSADLARMLRATTRMATEPDQS
ncbi:MAG: cyclic nucleotide-binding domain-containing protein [Myxococcota bacterium]|nr:cyclic nucleotide-binding domain-containing protein [Myxococcota bacterium]